MIRMMTTEEFKEKVRKINPSSANWSKLIVISFSILT